MHNILRYIRMNKKKLIKVALILAFLIILLQALNYLAGRKQSVEYNNYYSNIQNETNGTIKSDKSAVSGEKVSSKEIKEVGNIIKNFVEFCNQREIERAYELISQQCKENLYKDIESFKNDYYARVFKGENRNYTVQNWTGNTYIVNFTEDLLATGKSISDASFTDYITIVEEKNEKKLNINSFINKKEINKENEKDNIKIKILNQIQFMEYSIYEIEVHNKTNGTILLSSLTNGANDIYLKDNNDNRINSYINELSSEELKVYTKNNKKIEIKFDEPYIKNRKINSLNFKNILLDYKADNYGASFKTSVSVNI